MRFIRESRHFNGWNHGFRFNGKSDQEGHTTRYQWLNFSRAYRSWMVPYLKARLNTSEFRPLLAFLYTDLACNLNCDYCYSKGKKIAGMSFETAVAAVDWLVSVGCRVLAYMGGEPLVRKDFIIALTRYAVDRGFFVYLPTNGVLLDDKFIDAIGEAGVATINLAVDAVWKREGLPKYFARIRPQFEYLVQREKVHGFITFLNINITGENVDDVRELTEIAHRHGIAMDYHICEPPVIDYEHFEQPDLPIWDTSNPHAGTDALIDWVIEKNLAGYTMVNSINHLERMKLFIRGRLPAWPCQAGRHSMVIRLDGSFAPCFELYGSDEDWGDIFAGPKFDIESLADMKETCSPHCLSTCNFQVSHYGQSMLHCLQWIAKHAYSAMFGRS